VIVFLTFVDRVPAALIPEAISYELTQPHHSSASTVDVDCAELQQMYENIVTEFQTFNWESAKPVNDIWHRRDIISKMPDQM
jgi:hypothetical protein